VGVGGRVEVGDGVIVSVTVDVDDITPGCSVMPLVDTKGSYVGKTAGVSAAGAQDTSSMESKNSEVFL